ncbi:hypothetical protein E1287_39205 [Actinomadura sp. KC06]|uniref:hypothetical protein n=1 Tax=Actinomadura sp. KC06 TaxID=2530369 RepID=UPI00105191DE|nr:hypothetical protein [Actinomadura sp. KC06]TDD23201.1 hypothetical protein E1287_39205 [Actinomadura sp. KC06]
MVNVWAVLVILVPPTAAIVRELIRLRKDAARRESIERLLNNAPSGLRITDRTPDGAVIDIVVGHLPALQSQAPHEQDRRMQ